MAENQDPYAAPFAPAGPVEVKPGLRVQVGDKVRPGHEERKTHALEYIAAQMGQMNQKMDVIIEELRKTRSG